MKIRTFRFLVCMVLICAFLVNVSPIRAEAISTGVAVSAGIVAGAIIYGLGVSIGDHPDEFNSLVSEAISAMETAGVLVTNGMMDVMSLGSGLFGVKSDVIQNLFDWLWSDSGVFLDPGVRISSTVRDSILKTLKNYASNSSTGHAYALFGFSISNNRITKMAVSRQPFVLESDGKYYSYEDGYKIYVNNFDVYSAYVGGSDANSNYARISGDDFVIYSGTELGFDVSVNGDLTTNFIANPGLSLAEGYPAWHQNAVVITGDDSIGDIYYPIALGNSMEETQSFTQEQVWAGEGTYVDTETGTGSGSITVPETVTLKDILAGVLSIPHAIATGIEKVVAAVVALPAAITDFFSISTDVNDFAVSLTDFFPFCIPFDIADFLSLLSAEPVAPCFEFDLVLPFQSEPYKIQLDLARFDDVAALARRLQLYVFIVGLAVVTREKYIRS